jgi:hypothetical protein
VLFAVVTLAPRGQLRLWQVLGEGLCGLNEHTVPHLAFGAAGVVFVASFRLVDAGQRGRNDGAFKLCLGLGDPLGVLARASLALRAIA